MSPVNGAVGRVVASDAVVRIQSPAFFLLPSNFIIKSIKNTKIKKKEAGKEPNWPKRSLVLSPTLCTYLPKQNHFVFPISAQDQCDQMARLFFNIWPFTWTEICPMGYKICQSSSKILPNSKYPPPKKKSPNTVKILPNWRNFAKSGHTAQYSLPDRWNNSW